ncbi:hypothetical protein AVEN_78406-1 [Araneus ventricosus]|uniref:Reverse transcriptase domain-containing protein n=1 Tax=Araneus ventricosus TaxID=182803 RepID=A0A4Y2JXR3_ARAVE|nr:hypothetical protein AVEN_78406-1 [Araneus ventricosus]
MILFQKHEFVFIADVRMMYRQILIHPDQRDLQIMVWKESPDQPTKAYQMNTITYGTTSAPYLAARTLNQLADDENDTFPDVSFIVQFDCYMDDILTVSNSLENTKELQTQLVQLLGRRGFADASTAAYGAAIYLQYPSSESKSTYMLYSKSCVAPINPVTIPRLELCAALLLSQMTQRVIKALNLTISAVVLYSDSTIVLAWMKKPPQEFKTFVYHRVTAIQELAKDFVWRHVQSEENMADFISRGVTPDSLQSENLWWNGPSFLRNGIENLELSMPDTIKDNDFICEFKQSEKYALLTNSGCDSDFNDLSQIVIII